MDCVCGCGREIHGRGRSADHNFIAAGVALELLAWDKNRASPVPGPDGSEHLIARGADCYQRLIYSLHEEGPGDPSDDREEWLRESGEMGLRHSDMTKKRLFGRGFAPPKRNEHDIDPIKRLRPELSFTKLVWVPTVTPPRSRMATTRLPGSSVCVRSATTACSPRTSSPAQKRACSASHRRSRRRSASPARPVSEDACDGRT